MPKDFTIRPDIDLTAVRRELRKLGATPTTLKLDTKGFKPLGRITGELGEFEKSLAASNARVIAFGASTTVIMGIQRAFSSLIKTTIDVEKQLTDINVIMNTSPALHLIQHLFFYSSRCHVSESNCFCIRASAGG